MPKVHNTRKQRAKELLKKLTRGPSIFGCGIETLNEEEFASRWKIWTESWIIHELKYLIPELREKQCE